MRSIGAIPAVALVPITRDNWLEAIALRVAPEQEALVPAVAVSLAKMAIRPDGPDNEYRSYGIVVDGTMVGFGQLVGLFGDPPTLAIGGFLIDRRFQGRGFGRAALRALVELARLEPACRHVVLTVVPHNTAARRLYASEGFEPVGEQYDNEDVFRLRIGDAAA